MSRRLIGSIFVGLIVIGCCAHPSARVYGCAQATVASPPSDSQRVLPAGLASAKLHLWYARSIRPGGILGTIRKNRLRLVGLQFHRRLLPTTDQLANGYSAPTLTYTANLIPYASVHIPQEAVPALYYTEGEPGQPLSTNGMGLYPVGLQVAIRPSSSLRPFLAGHAGVLYFFDPVPDERGKQLNFAVGIGGGLEISLAARTALTLAYRYHHLSNGFRGSINPGLDANVLYFGVGIAL